MNKLILTVVLAVAAFAARAYNTTLGANALSGASGCNDNVAVGDSVMRGASAANNNIAIGRLAGYGLENADSNIIIGNNALGNSVHVSGVVAIGDGELQSASYNNDTTSINGEQIWFSQTSRAFSLNPVKHDSFTNSPIWYKSGELHFVADKIYTKDGAVLGGGSSVIDGLLDDYVVDFGHTNLLDYIEHAPDYNSYPAEGFVSNFTARAVGHDFVCCKNNGNPNEYGDGRYYPQTLEISFDYMPSNGAPWKTYSTRVRWGEYGRIDFGYEVSWDRCYSYSQYWGYEYMGTHRNFVLNINYHSDGNEPSMFLEFSNGSWVINGLSFSLVGGLEARAVSRALDSTISRETPASTAWVESRKVDRQYDLYLAEWGDDSADGKTPITPLRTIQRCYEVADDFSYVGVFAGTYEPPTVTNSTTVDSHEYTLYFTEKILHFKSIEGKGKTFIVGGQKNTQVKDGNKLHGEWNRGLSFYYGYQRFEGFTIHEMRPFYGNVGTYGTAPPFALVRLIDCVVRCPTGGNRIGVWDNGEFLMCQFIDTEFLDYEITCDNYGGYINDIINSCYFENVAFRNLKYHVTNGYSWTAFGRDNELFNTFIQLAADSAIPNKYSRASTTGMCCTVVGPHKADMDMIVNPAHFKGNVYAVPESTNEVVGANLYVAPSAVGEDGMASGIDSPIVRTDGSADWGWRDSGLALRKIVLRDVRLAFDGTAIMAYTNGVAIGTISLTPIPQLQEPRNSFNNVPVPNGWNNSPPPEPEAEITVERPPLPPAVK